MKPGFNLCLYFCLVEKNKKQKTKHNSWNPSVLKSDFCRWFYLLIGIITFRKCFMASAVKSNECMTFLIIYFLHKFLLSRSTDLGHFIPSKKECFPGVHFFFSCNYRLYSFFGFNFIFLKLNCIAHLPRFVPVLVGLVWTFALLKGAASAAG